MVLAEQQPSAESTAIFNPQILHNIHEAHQRNSYQYDASIKKNALATHHNLDFSQQADMRLDLTALLKQLSLTYSNIL